MTIQQKREMRQAKAKELRNLVDKHPGASWGADQQKQYDTLANEIEGIDAEVQREQRTLDIEALDAHTVNRVANSGGITLGRAEDVVAAERDVFNVYLRKGINAALAKRDEYVSQGLHQIQNTMSTTTTTEGGYTVPTTVAATLVEALKAFGGMREVAGSLTTSSGETINFPTTDATTEVGEILAQNATAADADYSFGVKSIGAYTFSSKTVAIPRQLLQDALVNLEAHTIARLAQRIGRAQNQYFTTGTGTSQPEGVVPAATLGKTGTTGQTTSIIYDDFIDLIHSVDPAYRMNAKFMLADSSLKVVKKLKDSQNRPLWLPGFALKEPDTINGYAYTINQDVATMAANAKSILFGDFSKYLIRDVVQVELFRFDDSAFMRKNQVGFLAFARADGKLLDTAAVKYYANSAT